jgi:hypothetical protein
MLFTLVMCVACVGAEPANFDELKDSVFDDISRGFIKVQKAYIQRKDDGRIHYSPGVIKQGLDCDVVLSSLYEIQLIRYSFMNTDILPDIEPALAGLDRRVFDAIAFRINTGNDISKDDQRKIRRETAAGLREALRSYATMIDRNAVMDPTVGPVYRCRVVFRNNTNQNKNVRIMSLTRYRMARAYGTEFFPSVYTFDKQYTLTCGTYVYSFTEFSHSHPPLTVKIYENDDYPL